MRRYYIIAILSICFGRLPAQLCATPGLDGPENISASINTYYPPAGSISLLSGSVSVFLGAVPAVDLYGNNFGNQPIIAGDLLLIIQIQDATINFENNANYGSGKNSFGPDGLGGTGYTSAGNSGKYEYVIATNAVPLTGGKLSFRGSGVGRGTVHSYYNAAASSTQGKKTFEVIRVPQYSNLILKSNISTPPFNGLAGGVIAFDVAGSMDFNGFTIDASARGFRGGYGIIANSSENTNSVYVSPSNDTRSVGKGEGIAGTPRYMWDGYNQVDNIDEGLPGGSYGKGAPGNAGGGGCDHNAGGGGGGNGGQGGVGGNGTSRLGTANAFPNGGRPGSNSYDNPIPDLTRIFLGGGGGGGDANSALTGVKGGVGGGIVLINVGTITGQGIILSNGADGAAGVSGSNPDGAGGGGAGGTVFIKVSNPDPASLLVIEAKGGNGGNTFGDSGPGDEHGPGGGAGGGIVFYNLPVSAVQVNLGKGLPGKANSGNGTNNGGGEGRPGISKAFLVNELPTYLQGGGSICYPELTTNMDEQDPARKKFPGSPVIYTIKISNLAGGGNAGGVQAITTLPSGIIIDSTKVRYTGDAGGPSTLLNTGTGNQVIYGDFNIAPGDTVIITISAHTDCTMHPGTFNASAQSIYLDPSRTFLNPKRKITGYLHAFPGTHTTYETGTAGTVIGSNYDGFLVQAEDIWVEAASPLSNNVINSSDNIFTFCGAGNPAALVGSNPTGGSEVYGFQWQQSPDNIQFTAINGATKKDFDPAVLAVSSYYRRMVSSLSCTPPVFSNVLFISVSQPAVADFKMPGFCLNDGAAIFTNLSSFNGSTTAPLSYTWNFGDPLSNQNSSTDLNPSHIFPSIGVYPVSLEVINGACVSNITKSFTVNGSIPKADFQVRDVLNLCSGQAVVFEDRASVNFGEITKIAWSFDAGSLTPPLTDDQPATRSSAPRTYSNTYPSFFAPADKDISVKMAVYSGLSCVNEQTQVITLHARPQVEFSPIDPVCISIQPVQLKGGKELQELLPGIGVYSGPGVNAQGYFTPAIAGVGQHSIQFTFTSDRGCSESKSQQVTVLPAPVVNGGILEILEGGGGNLPATASGSNLSFTWSPAADLSADDILQPFANPKQDIDYTLTATSDNGCNSTGVVKVKVLKTPRIPNVFSPNGDGINDLWRIESLSSYANATVEIFNRYGQKVFSSVGYLSPWNGKLNGNDLPIGTYYYVIDPKKGRKVMAGSVTIIR